MARPFISTGLRHCGRVAQFCNTAHRRAIELTRQLSRSLSDAKDLTQGTHVLPLLAVQVHACFPYEPWKDFRANQGAIERPVRGGPGEGLAATREASIALAGLGVPRRSRRRASTPAGADSLRRARMNPRIMG